ncbi:MAG: [Thermoguttaceae bacterium]|nr:[FeFe] hydrogenase H-cluster radical SAM maturase HydE [Thermoguttaceae bacterium]
MRGLIEIGNICKNDFLYCGIRRSAVCERYRLTPEDILECCREGYALGFRTFVLQGGEDPHFTDGMLTDLIRRIKSEFADVAITLSLGERSRESYLALREAGADRYLLRHETASREHYERLHPSDMYYDERIRCLNELKELGYQVGCGFMVGSPHQSAKELAEDLKLIEEFTPSMCGIGPFIPAAGTPFADYGAGSLELTCYLLSIIRLIHPHLLLPATTALGSIHPEGREMGILAGANVVMPNLSPPSVRRKYALYDNKATDGAESGRPVFSRISRRRRRSSQRYFSYLASERRFFHPASAKRIRTTPSSPNVGFCTSYPSSRRSKERARRFSGCCKYCAIAVTRSFVAASIPTICTCRVKTSPPANS